MENEDDVPPALIYGEWKNTPWWLRLIGYKDFRRKVTLDYYHLFSEWEYSDTKVENFPGN